MQTANAREWTPISVQSRRDAKPWCAQYIVVDTTAALSGAWCIILHWDLPAMNKNLDELIEEELDSEGHASQRRRT